MNFHKNARVALAADELVVAESALLAGDEVLLGATGNVTLANGSRLASTAARSTPRPARSP